MSYLKLCTQVEEFVSASTKLYFIACCFPPFGRGNAITNSCVANLLARRFKVEVVCMERLDGGVISYQEDESLVKRLNPNLHIHRVRADSWFGLNTLLYATGILPCYFLNWAWRVWRSRDQIFRKDGVVFAVYPVFSDLLLGFAISRFYKMPLLIDFRDDFLGVMSSGWRSIFRPYYAYIERMLVKSAQKISVTTELLQRDIVKRYGLSADQVEVVYNIVPSVQWQNNVDGSLSEKLNVIYAGAMSSVQKPEVLLKAYAQLRKTDEKWSKCLTVDFFGPESPYFQMAIRKWLGEGCNYGGFLPQEEIAQRVLRADIGFLSLSDTTYAYATPTKLFDYIEAGIPIVAALPLGASRQIIEDHQIGLVVDPDDTAGLAELLKRMVEDENLRRKCCENMQPLREKFCKDRQIEKWFDMLAAMRSSDYSENLN